MTIEKIKKRSGKIENFDKAKIEKAIEKACIATETSIDSEFLSSITNDVIGILKIEFFERAPSVEDVQDTVEKALAENGLFEVAKAYILYREEHAEIRESKKRELLKKIEDSDLTVKKKETAVCKNLILKRLERQSTLL